MESVIVRFTPEQFIHTPEPYDYLVGIESATERDVEIAAYKKFAKDCGISAMTFKEELRKAEARIVDTKPATRATNKTEFTNQPITLHCPGYVCTDEGVWTEGGGMYAPQCVSLQPIMPIAQIVNIDTGEHKTKVAFRRGKEWKEIILPSSVLASSSAIVKPLREQGAIVDSETARPLVSYFSRMEAANIETLPHAWSASRLGWLDDKKFLPYETDLEFDGTDGAAQIYESMKEFGSKDAWFNLVNDEIRHRKNTIARAMLATAFASVVIKPLNQNSFWVHCWGQSDTGKTVSMMVAASVWGRPEGDGFIRSFDATGAGFEFSSAFLNNLPLCMDELSIKEGDKEVEKVIQKMIYSFCGVSNKSRATRNLTVRASKTWKSCAITTGETPILKENAWGGMVNRVIELDTGTTKLFQDAENVAETVKTNYGFAGRMFVEALQQDGAVDELKAYYKEYESEIKRVSDTTVKQAILGSIILAADKFAAVHVFHDDNNLRTDEIVKMLRTNAQTNTYRRVYEWLMGYVQVHKYYFEPLADEANIREAWGKIEETPQGEKVCINNTIFGKIMKEANCDPVAFRKWADEQSIMDHDKGRLDKQVRMSRLNDRVRCTCLKMGAFSGSEEDEEAAPDEYMQISADEIDLPF